MQKGCVLAKEAEGTYRFSPLESADRILHGDKVLQHLFANYFLSSIIVCMNFNAEKSAVYASFASVSRPCDPEVCAPGADEGERECLPLQTVPRKRREGAERAFQKECDREEWQALWVTKQCRLSKFSSERVGLLADRKEFLQCFAWTCRGTKPLLACMCFSCS